MEKKIEVLAPAGSYDVLTAVIKAGADAVYLGGSMFSARAYAGNFDKEELLRAIDYAHLYDRKIYLTVNTLMKEREIKDYLYEYLEPFYHAGLDAVIVQDFGVFKLIRDYFPEMPIHASTQMTITGEYGSELLKEMGASRIVTSRELNLEEIKKIKQNCDVEIESFVHGALCYCYSGQCLLSSFNGQRSGNRGRCAQPCRLPYSYKGTEEYILSPKDMCALEILPSVIEAGVDSLKIEGRMKNVSYAAGVTAIYRKYCDLYLEKGKRGYKVDERDINDLMDLFNRGMFTKGYYVSDKGRNMLSTKRPNHMGTKALEVMSNSKGKVEFRALEDITLHDVFEIDADHSFESGSNIKKGEKLVVNLPSRYNLNAGKVIFRTRKGSLVNEIQRSIVEKDLKKSIDAYLTVVENEPIVLVFTDLDTGISVSCEGNVVGHALKQPVSEERLKESICKMGNSSFAIHSVNVYTQGSVFVPMSELNDLRRKCCEKLKEEIIEKYRRKEADIDNVLKNKNVNLNHDIEKEEIKEEIKEENKQLEKYVYLKKEKYINDLKNIKEISGLYIDFSVMLGNVSEVCDKLVDSNKKIIPVLPYIIKGKSHEIIINFIRDCFENGINTFLIRSIGQIGLISSVRKEKNIWNNMDVSIVSDAGVYTWNSFSIDFVKEVCIRKNIKFERASYPFELTSKEMIKGDISRELVVYTKVPVMISEQCIKKTIGKCEKNRFNNNLNNNISSDSFKFKNRQKEYLAVNECSMCYNIIYDSQYMDITDLYDKIQDVDPDVIRYELIDDSFDVSEIMDILHDHKKNDNSSKGHFELGVE